MLCKKYPLFPELTDLTTASVMDLMSEEESYSAELAEVELRVFLSLAKEANTFSAVYP